VTVTNVPPGTRVGVIIAAAGAGTRLGLGSKALVQLNGRTALSRVLELFLGLEEVAEVVVAGPPGRLERAQAEVGLLAPAKTVRVCAGGETRQQSVRAGLGLLHGCTHVLVHDAARPMATPGLARRVLAAAVEHGAALPGLPSRDAVKRVDGGRLVESLDRSKIVLAQTPQGFAYQLLLRAHFEAADAGLVGDDDAQLVAAAGHQVAVVAGEPTNIKLTTAEDMEVLQALMRGNEAAQAAEGAARS
jgi:2-C-methyl-D-erythritol 4-phosphate cytidylyltransferase